MIALGIDDPGAYIGDEVTSTELGVKMMFNDSVRLNGAVYNVKWDDATTRKATLSDTGTFTMPLSLKFMPPPVVDEISVPTLYSVSPMTGCRVIRRMVKLTR